MAPAAVVLDENRGVVVKLLQEGMSRSQVGDVYGVTKNVVISWLRSRKIVLPSKAPLLENPAPDPDRSKPKQLKRDPSLDDFDLTSPSFPRPLDGIGVPFEVATAHQCQRPLWSHDANIGNVCGLPVKPKSRYCPACADRLGFQKEAS